MAYLEAYVVWEGALDEERLFEYGTTSAQGYENVDTGADNALRTWASNVIKDAKAERASAQVYVIEHEHGMENVDCECMQYLTDHSPYMSYSPDEE